MDIVLIDDSLAYDGFSPNARPLGGGQKAVAALATALARLGHSVQVFTRTLLPLTIDGVAWDGPNSPRPNGCDLLIAVNDPAGLNQVPAARCKLVWSFTAATALLPWQSELTRHQALVVVAQPGQAQGWPVQSFDQLRLIAPAAPDIFRTSPTDGERSPEPLALVTTHPDCGLDALLDGWRDVVSPQLPGARLLIVSALLQKAQAGLPVDERHQERARRIAGMAAQGVSLTRPLPDSGMAGLYRRAWLHLYPGDSDDLLAWTLLDSQACGLPAVARDRGGVRVRLLDGQTGQIVPDHEALANVTLHLLRHPDSLAAMRQEAQALQRQRSWNDVARSFLALCPLPENAA